MNKYIDLRFLYKHKDILTKQQLLTLRGQALNGNIDGAKRGLNRILERKNRGI